MRSRRGSPGSMARTERPPAQGHSKEGGLEDSIGERGTNSERGERMRRLIDVLCFVIILAALWGFYLAAWSIWGN